MVCFVFIQGQVIQQPIRDESLSLLTHIKQCQPTSLAQSGSGQLNHINVYALADLDSGFSQLQLCPMVSVFGTGYIFLEQQLSYSKCSFELGLTIEKPTYHGFPGTFPVLKLKGSCHGNSLSPGETKRFGYSTLPCPYQKGESHSSPLNFAFPQMMMLAVL